MRNSAEAHDVTQKHQEHFESITTMSNSAVVIIKDIVFYIRNIPKVLDLIQGASTTDTSSVQNCVEICIENNKNIWHWNFVPIMNIFIQL